MPDKQITWTGILDECVKCNASARLIKEIVTAASGKSWVLDYTATLTHVDKLMKEHTDAFKQ